MVELTEYNRLNDDVIIKWGAKNEKNDLWMANDGGGHFIWTPRWSQLLSVSSVWKSCRDWL